MRTPTEWDARYRLQAGWTRDLRQYAYRQANLPGAGRVLEVGCGTGAILADFRDRSNLAVFGIDIDRSALQIAREQTSFSRLSAADAHSLPFADGVFGVTLCHYFLLWAAQPEKAIAEMVRVTRPGGFVLVLAEPDYGGRIDYPPPLERLGALQTEALARQGVDPRMGRKLAGLLKRAGLQQVQHGVVNAGWGAGMDEESYESEWRVLRSDLGEMISGEEIDDYERIDREAWRLGERVLFVPTFYAWGRVP